MTYSQPAWHFQVSHSHQQRHQLEGKGDTFIPHPDLMHLSSRDIYSCTNPESLPRGVFILWVCDSQGTLADHVRCETRVRVWRIVGVGSISPSENVGEAPASDRPLVVRA